MVWQSNTIKHWAKDVSKWKHKSFLWTKIKVSNTSAYYYLIAQPVNIHMKQIFFAILICGRWLMVQIFWWILNLTQKIKGLKTKRWI